MRLFGALLLFLGVFIGFYIGLWLLLIGGIVELVNFFIIIFQTQLVEFTFFVEGLLKILFSIIVIPTSLYFYLKPGIYAVSGRE